MQPSPSAETSSDPPRVRIAVITFLLVDRGASDHHAPAPAGGRALTDSLRGTAGDSQQPHPTWNDRLANPIWKSSMMTFGGAAGSVAAPKVTKIGVECSTVGCAYGMPGARRKSANVST